MDGLARLSAILKYGYVLRMNNGNVLRRAWNSEVAGRRGRPNMTWERQVEEHTDQIGLKKEDAIDRTKWRWCEQTFKRHGVNPATCVNADKTGFKKVDLSLPLSLLAGSITAMLYQRIDLFLILPESEKN